MPARSPEIDHFVGIAKRRVGLISEVFEKGQVYMRAELSKTALAMAVCEAAIAELHVEGREHLEAAWSQVLAGKRLGVTFNHQSDADHDVKRLILRKLNLEEFADRMFFVAGLKMLEREETRMFMPAENALLVATPTDLHNMEKADRWIDRGRLTEEEENIVINYIELMGALSTASSSEYERLVKLGMIPSFYPEATRTRDEQGRMMKAPSESASLIPKDPEAYILPWVTHGTTQIMTLDDRILLNNATISTVIGKRYQVKELDGIKLDGIFIDDSTATQIDIVMARLGALKPELVMPQHLESYQKLCGTYNPGRGTREIFCKPISVSY